MSNSIFSAASITRRAALQGLATGATLLASPMVVRNAFAQTGKIRLGAPFHRTGIGASYGRWYERTAYWLEDIGHEALAGELDRRVEPLLDGAPHGSEPIKQVVRLVHGALTHGHGGPAPEWAPSG